MPLVVENSSDSGIWLWTVTISYFTLEDVKK